MKSRKFMKKLLTVRWMLALLIVLALGVVAICYFAVGLDVQRVEIDNIEFDGSEENGFINYQTKAEGELKTNLVVGENDKYVMFLDEETTIVTVAVKSTLISNGDPKNPKDYKVTYSSADPEGATGSSKANFTVTYSSSDISNPGVKDFNSNQKSVNYTNTITGEQERRYSIKFMKEENAVQIYYSIGDFASIGAYFTENIYGTLYAPARCVYDSDEEYNKAVITYEEYLNEVGDLSTTFEERFRGNVETKLISKKNKDTGVYEVYHSDEIIVHSVEARDYLIDVVFPELEQAGLGDFSEYDKHFMDQEAYEAAQKSKDKTKVSWTLKGIPAELLDFHGEYYKKFFNNENSPLTNNPFLTVNDYRALRDSHYAEYRADGSSLLYTTFILQAKNSTLAKPLYALLYTDEPQYVYTDSNGEEHDFASSGYPMRDEEGNFVYDENGNVKKALYSTDLVALENAKHGIVTESLAVFKIALEFRLTNSGLVVTIPSGSLVDSTNVKESDPDYALLSGRHQIVRVSLCPFFTEANENDEGYIIIPDGSGALINMNNGKVDTMSGRYYGNDQSYVSNIKPQESAQLLLGMFAFVKTTPGEEGGLLTVVEKGGGQVEVTATQRSAKLQITLRDSEGVRTGTVNDGKEFVKYDKTLSPSDIVINYIILDETETEYSTVAKKYQDYLVERDGLTFKDNTDKILNDITFLGTFEKYSLLFGIKYLTADTLTTFDQAIEIIDGLKENSVDTISVSYKGWTNEHLEYELGGNLKVASQLGKTASMRTFYKYCVEGDITFFPEINITTTKGYDYLLGSTRFSARGVGNEEAIHYQYDLATGRQDKKLSKTYNVSPLYFLSIADKISNDFAKLGIWEEEKNGGFYLTDLGNQWNGNYRAGRQVYSADSIVYQQATLEKLADGNLVKIEAPCDYAFKYVDIATGVPVNSAMYSLYDETIPFYQLVVSGLFDYTTDNVNGLSNRSSKWYFAKALETGSNLSYLISAEDPAILLETDYTQYYQAFYENWEDTIINFTKEINSLGIHGCRLTNHEIIDGVSIVTYTNKTNANLKVVLAVNVTDTAKNYKGQTIPAYGYVKLA